MDSIFKIAYLANLFKTKDVEGYENLQKRISDKKEYFEKVLPCLKNVESSLKDCLSTVQSSNKSLEIIQFSPEENNIQDLIKSIYQKISNNIYNNFLLLNNIISEISSHKSNLVKELDYYSDLKKVNKDLQEEKEKLNKNKETYHKVGKKAEKEIKKFIKNITNIDDIYQNEILRVELDYIVEPPKTAISNYLSSLSKTNELIKKYNEKQSLIFRYLPQLSSEDGVFFFRLIKIYLQNMEKENQFLITNIDKIKSNDSLETKTKLMELIELSEKTKKEEKIQKLMDYQTELDLSKCENEKDFQLYSNSIALIKNFIDNDLFPNYNYDKEIKNFRMNQIIKKLFKEKGEIDSKLSEDFINSLNDLDVHRGVFIILSQLRTNSKFARTKFLIDLLGKGFNILLEKAIENKLYENIKNCIILSQTYYYPDEKNNKIYIFEYIKNNKYFQNSQFWRIFIENMIKAEFIRFQTSFPDSNFNVEKNINITDKIKDKLNEVVFSQLLTYASNMKDFNIDKRVILKIIDEFVEKYNYLSKNNLDNLYAMVTQGEEVDIEKIRKEYDPSLEGELIDEGKKIDEEKQNINNNEENNEIKNNEKEEEEKKNKENDNNENEKNNINEKKNENEINE